MTEQDLSQILNAPDTGRRVVRGTTVRGIGYVLGMVLTAVASVFLLRHLGPADFGRFSTVMALISIVVALADGGLTTIGLREYVKDKSADERRFLMANLLGIRLLLAPLGALIAVGFSGLAGYPEVMVMGTALAGIAMVFYMAQVTLALSLSANLKLVSLSLTELNRQFLIALSFGILVLAGSTLLPFFTVQIPAAALALVFTAFVVRKSSTLRPAFNWAIWRKLIVESLPVAAALAVNVVYFRVLMIMMSLLATAVATGIFATSFRVLEILIGVPVLMLSTAFPVLAHAGQENRERLRYVLQRMTEVGLIAACFLIVVVSIAAGPVIEIIGGSQYDGAVPVLRLQTLALLGAFLGQSWQLGLISINRQTALIFTNLIALTTVLVLGFLLIPSFAAQGAAVAAALGEVVLAVATLVMLIRADRELTPNFGFSGKVALATGAALLPLLIPGLPDLPAALAAAVIYAAVVFFSKALPPETIQAFMRRSELGPMRSEL